MGLTLTLGGLLSIVGLVCENLTEVVSAGWFRTGSIPDERRRELIGHLDARFAREAREAILHVLETVRFHSERSSQVHYSFQIAYQRAAGTEGSQDGGPPEGRAQ